MAELTEETIQTLTELSRIHCSHQEKESFLKELEKMVSYFKLLEEVDTEGVSPYRHSQGVNVFREDEVEATLSRELFLENAPSQTGGLIRVPKILNLN